MSNNPGKKGKPAPWVKREAKDRRDALEDYLRKHHPAYREWCSSRNAVGQIAQAEAEKKFPAMWEVSQSLKHVNKVINAWDKKNKNPMTSEEYKALEADFSKIYVPIDRS